MTIWLKKYWSYYKNNRLIKDTWQNYLIISRYKRNCKSLDFKKSCMHRSLHICYVTYIYAYAAGLATWNPGRFVLAKIPLAICILITKYTLQFNVHMYFFFRWEGHLRHCSCLDFMCFMGFSLWSVISLILRRISESDIHVLYTSSKKKKKKPPPHTLWTLFITKFLGN